MERTATIVQPREHLYDALEIQERHLKLYQAIYYSFLIPYTSASGAIVFTIVTQNLSKIINIMAGIFIMGLTLFYVLWLFCAYRRIQNKTNKAATLWNHMNLKQDGNPYLDTSDLPEQLFFWFIFVMGLLGAFTCFIT
jgi:hypothetical protein